MACSFGLIVFVWRYYNQPSKQFFFKPRFLKCAQFSVRYRLFRKKPFFIVTAARIVSTPSYCPCQEKALTHGQTHLRGRRPAEGKWRDIGQPGMFCHAPAVNTNHRSQRWFRGLIALKQSCRLKSCQGADYVLGRLSSFYGESIREIKGISINSDGWIFSRWANKTMQEDLSVAT